MTLYGAAKTPAAALTADGTVVVALTDSSTGTASETIAAMVNMATVADNSGGTAGGDVKDVPDGGTGDATGAWETATIRNTAITVINDNFKDLMAGYTKQVAHNIVVKNAIASLANKLSDLITHLNDGR